MDNTAAPYISKPIQHGANVIVYSTTKYIGGHGISIGGLLIDGGNFDWEAAGDRFKMLNSPDPSLTALIPIFFIIFAAFIEKTDVKKISPFFSEYLLILFH